MRTGCWERVAAGRSRPCAPAKAASTSARRVGWLAFTASACSVLAGNASRAAQSLGVYAHRHDHVHLPDGRVREADGRIVEAHEHHHGEQPHA